MDRFPHKIIGGGAAFMAVVTALGWGGVSTMIRGQMKMQAKLWNHTDAWRMWQDSPSPYYLHIYFFHLENAEEVSKGEKPKLMEKGPYVYVESRWKEDIEYEKGNDTLLYRQMRKYSFVPDMSNGLKEEDEITIINIPLVGVTRIAQDTPEKKDKMLESINSKASEEKLFVTHTVKELLFEGYDAKPYEELGKEYNTQIVPEGGGEAEEGETKNDDEESAPIQMDYVIPDYLSDGRYALFDHRNVTDGGTWEIWSGRKNASAYGLIRTWNGLDKLPFYTKGEPCHFINGSDGTIFTPPMKKETILRVYEKEYCRSRKYEYDMASAVKEIKTVRFRPKKEHLQSPKNNPDHACYCPYDDLEKCGKDGMATLSPCMKGVPLYISNPHFLHAEEEVLQSVEGLSPDQEKHETYLDFDPISGLIFEGRRRWQINVEVEPVSEISALASAPKTVVPVYWVEEKMIVEDSKVKLLRILDQIQKGSDTVRWGLLAIGAAVLLIGLLLACVRKGSSKVNDRITLIQ